MAADNVADWVSWIAGIGLLVVLGGLVFLAWWALYSDRSRTRRRCPRCWHQLDEANGMVCPECGFQGQDEREFERTRRRWGVALMAILGCTGVGVFVIDQANTRGWMSYVPTGTLVWVLPAFDNPNGPVMFDLDRRMRADHLDPDQWIAVTRRCVEGERGARPPGDAWGQKYGGLLNTVRGRMRNASGQAWRAEAEPMLRQLPPRIDLATREIWPLGVEPTIDVTAKHWWPDQPQWRVRAEPLVPAATSDIHVMWDKPIQERSYSLRLPALAAGRHDVDVTLTFERRERPGEPWTEIGTQKQTVSFSVGPPLSDMMTPVSNAAMDAAMNKVLEGGVVWWRRGLMPVRVKINATATLGEEFDGTAVGIRIDIMRNGVLARQLESWWLAGPGGNGRLSAWEVPMWDQDVLAASGWDNDEWTIRLRSVPELALRVTDATKYWEGELTRAIPVERSGRRRISPAIGWIRGEVAERLDAEETARPAQ